MLAINKRLELVASYVENKRLADIGSDHAYLPIFLAKEGKIDFAIAGEIVEGPHKVSIKNVKEEGLSNTIDCRKAAGLDAITLEDNIEVITICGMGGKLISDILEDGKDKLGYNIVAENIMEEDGHIYEVIVAKAGEMNLTEEEKVFGKYLLKEKSNLFIKKQKFELNKIKYILSQLQKAKEIQKDKVDELEKKYKEIQDIISV